MSFGRRLTAARKFTVRPGVDWRIWYNDTMRFIPWYLTRGDVLGALFVLAVLGLLIFTYIRFPGFAASTGFGPDWDCKSVPQGDPVCVKKIAR